MLVFGGIVEEYSAFSAAFSVVSFLVLSPRRVVGFGVPCSSKK